MALLSKNNSEEEKYNIITQEGIIASSTAKYNRYLETNTIVCDSKVRCIQGQGYSKAKDE